MRWRFPSPPACSDWSSYGRLLTEILRNSIAEVPGDVVEIGVMLGGGTYKLCKYFEREAPGKQVYAIDIFDPSFDVTGSEHGPTMSQLYDTLLADPALGGRSQREVFDAVTADCRNLTVIAGDSAAVELPTNRVAFAHIEGNHSAEWLRSNLELIWPELSPGGIVGFDDYGSVLPEVTHTLHALIGERSDQIARVWTSGPKTLFVQRGA